MMKKNSNKTKLNNLGAEQRFSALIDRMSGVFCPDCGKPVWLDLVKQIKKIKKLILSISFKKDVKEEVLDFFTDIAKVAESYYLKKFKNHYYQITDAEELVLERFQEKKEVKKIVNDSIIKMLEDFPVLADWMAIPEGFLPFNQKKALLLILRKVKR